MTAEEIAKLAETVAGTFEPRSSFVSAEMRPGMAPTGPEEWLLSPLGYWTDARPYSTASEILPVFSLDGSHPDRDAIITGRMLDWFHMERHELYLRSWVGIGGDLLWRVEWYCDSYPECIGKPIHSRVLAVAKAFVAVFGGGK